MIRSDNSSDSGTRDMQSPAQPNEQLKDRQQAKQYVIPYLPVAVGRASGGRIILLVLAIVAVIGAALAMLATVSVKLSLTLGIILAATAVLAGLVLLIMRERVFEASAIKISEEGLHFPAGFAPDLLFKCDRSWDDIANILLGSMLLDGKQGTYEYDLENSADKRKLFIYFKSGGHASIDLRHLSKKGSEQLFVAIESWCLDFSRAPQLAKDDDNRSSTGKQQQLERELPQSYTELWEQEMQDHFSATNFVPLEKGSFLQDDKLRIVMPLASGGLSAVYLAETRDQELRVVKEAVLPPTLDEELQGKAKELFKREARILQNLSHPKIAGVFDYFVENGRDYLVLEFIPGNSLRQNFHQNGLLPELVVLSHGVQIAEILEYLHSQDPPVIHRDISPDNLVLREDGTIVLIDFGAANEYMGTATGTLVGKQSYISPEQFKGKARTASDIYSTGATLYFMLTGEDPEALSTSRPRQINPELSPGVDELIAGLTETDMDKRVASAQDMREQLESILKEGGGAVIDLSGGDAHSTQ